MKRINCGDFNFVPSKDELIDAANFIQAKMDQGGSVYVHCKAGRTRSATVVATYLILHCGHTGNMAQRFFEDISFSRMNSNGTYRYEKQLIL